MRLDCRPYHAITIVDAEKGTAAVILASRNSPISLLTGASYQTLQIYHRWVARWTFLHALLHSIGYTVDYLLYGNGYYTAAFKEAYWNWGIVVSSREGISKEGAPADWFLWSKGDFGWIGLGVSVVAADPNARVRGAS